MPKHIKFPDRAPTPEELSRTIDVANLREKTMISLLALGGFRIGTLVKLKYSHIKEDFEANRVPIHIHVEADITKGKYHAYDTFIGIEAVGYLKAYFRERKAGNERLECGHIRGMPPETITDDSPLIRDEHSKKVKGINPGNIHRTINRLYIKAGLIEKGKTKHYPLRIHSLRKYFRTQLGSTSTIPTDYIDYMMGHTVNIYNDIKMKGIEHLRNLYSASGLSIRPKTRISKIEQLKIVAESLGLNPDQVLSRDALTMPYRTIIDSEERTIQTLNQALKEAILRELKT